MKINGKLQMNFGPVGQKMLVDNYSNTTIEIDGKEPFEADSEGNDCFDKAGDWITPEFKPGQEFSLSIPSGIFSGKVTSVERRMEDKNAINDAAALGQVREHEAQEMQIVTVEGQWDGKQAGITDYAGGGLCGLGTFFLSEVSSVEGTFGKAQSLGEYNARAGRYRALYYSRSMCEETSASSYSLTPKGEAELRRYLSEIPGSGEEEDPSFRNFRKWLDLQFPKLNHQLERQECRARTNPTERNLRRLKRYQEAFASR